MTTPSIRPKTMRATLAREDDTLEAVMRRMDWAALEIVLVVTAEGALAGTITDGDIRRALLAGRSLRDPASRVMNPRPIAVQEGTSREDALAILRRFSIRHLPVLDARRRPIRLERLEDLVDAPAAPSAVIMAGGLGQRLRPLTEHTPKPLLEVANRPIMDHILAGLRDSGIREVVISVNYLGDRIRRHVGDGRGHELNVNYVSETQRLGTAGALALLQPRPREPFLVMNGDLLTGIRFDSLFRFQRKQAFDMVVCVRKHVIQVPYGVVELDRDRVTGLQEKPSFERFINAGIYMIAPRCLDWLPPNAYCDMPDLIRSVLDRGGSVGAFPIIEYWRDIGNPEDYRKVNCELMNLEAALHDSAELSAATVPLEALG
jgi:dTDP-glucose pyrophosphorylase